MMPRPIHVSVGRQFLQNKVFASLFQKAVVSKGKAFGRAPQRAKYFVVGSAFAGELRELLAALARGGFCKRKAPLRNCRYAQPSPTFQWTVGRQRERGTQFLQIKFSSTFFKRWRVSSGQRLLVEHSSARNTFIVKRQVTLIAC